MSGVLLPLMACTGTRTFINNSCIGLDHPTFPVYFGIPQVTINIKWR